jgi:glycosidase
MKRLLTRGLLLAAASLTATTCVTVDPSPPVTNNVEDWRDEIIYQIVVDRFEDGDPNNNFNVDWTRPAAYHGGDWQGIIDRLDYIETLGVTTLWISPVVRNVEEDAGFASYHGYWTQHFLDVNPHFGTLEKLREMVQACHARNIKVVLDIVTNHVGQVFYYDINRNGMPDIVFFGGGGNGSGSRNPDQPSSLRRASEWDPEYDSRGVQGFTSLGENGLAPVEWVFQPEIGRMPPEPEEFANEDWYNRKGRVTVWESDGNLQNARLDTLICAECDTDPGDACVPEPGCAGRVRFAYVREQEILGDFPGGLKDLRTELPEVRRALIRAFQYWIQAADFDGFRIDTLKHVEPSFFEEFAPAMRQFAKQLGKENFFMFGEAFDGNDALLGQYTHGQGVDSVFYFSAKYRVFDDVFGRGAPTAGVRRLFEERDAMDDRGAIPEDDPNLPRYGATPKTNGPTDSEGRGLAPKQLLVHFLDNHDVPRFLYDFKDLRRLHLALVYQLTFDGVPCIYYGTEQAFAGGPDPSNREDMWVSGFRTDGETFRHTRALTALRRDLEPLRRGTVEFLWTTEARADDPNALDAGLLAYARVLGGARVVVVMNTSAEKPARTRDAERALPTGLPGGTVLEDRLNPGQSFTVQPDGTLDLELAPMTARVLVPR